MTTTKQDRPIRKVLEIENAKIFYRNFEGRSSQYNPAGSRNFCVAIDDLELARILEEEGWNIKYKDPTDPADPKIAYTQIKVSYSGRIPPKIQLIGSNRRFLDQDSVHILDWAEIESVDLVINPFEWEVRGERGIKGYLKSMYVTIVEDKFEKKYRDVPDKSEDESPF